MDICDFLANQSMLGRIADLINFYERTDIRQRSDFFCQFLCSTDNEEGSTVCPFSQNKVNSHFLRLWLAVSWNANAVAINEFFDV